LNPEIPAVQIDRSKILQVLVNLFTNAILEMPGGGQLSVTTEVALGFEGMEKAVVMWIEDTGPGIPEEHLGKVFDPFFTKRRAKGGTGLGLSIVKSIMEMHRGKIRIENREEGGARVIGYFPLSEQDASKEVTVR
jgi:signal transduction histidine kinase